MEKNQLICINLIYKKQFDLINNSTDDEFEKNLPNCCMKIHEIMKATNIYVIDIVEPLMLQFIFMMFIVYIYLLFNLNDNSINNQINTYKLQKSITLYERLIKILQLLKNHEDGFIMMDYEKEIDDNTIIEI